MQDEIIRTRAEEEERIDASIIGLLLDSTVVGPWSVEELARELEDRLAVDDALARLQAVALIHRAGNLVFPTRAAIRARQLAR